MADRRGQSSPRDPGRPNVRVEALIIGGEGRPALAAVADLDLDRVPDPDGGVRVLLTGDEAVQLVERGYEVRLVRSLLVAPLDPKLVMDDETARALLEVRVQGVERQDGS